MLVDHRVKMKETEKENKYLAREPKNWNMKVTLIPIVIGALGTITKEFLKVQEDFEVRGRVETTIFLRSATILKRVQRLEETCCHSNSNERLSANADVKKYSG